MLNPNEIIYTKSWMDLAENSYDSNSDDGSILESGIVYCNIEHIHKFFEKCKLTDNKYIIISAFSDFGVSLQKEYPVAIDMLKFIPFLESDIANLEYNALQIPPRCELDKCNIEDKYSVKCYAYTYSTFPEIPNNVIKWFTANAQVKDDKIVNIPLGVHKRPESQLCSTSTNPLLTNSYDRVNEGTTATNPLLVNRSDRVNWVYLNWQDNTLERFSMKNAYTKLNPDWVTISKDEKPYKEYITDLSKHSFAICPEGNGLDCYRMLECLYSGCIPIVKHHSAYSYMDDMPHVKVNSWSEINPEFLKKQLKTISMSDFDMSKITLSYWKNEINKLKELIKD